MDPLHFGEGGEAGVIPVQGIDDLAVSVKAPGVGGHLFGAVVDHDLIGGGMDGERFSHEVIGDGIAVGIENHQGGLGGFDRGMEGYVVPGFFGKRPEFLLGKEFRRGFSCGPVDGLVLVVDPFMKRLIEGR
jgi:hypothetical protein